MKSIWWEIYCAQGMQMSQTVLEEVGNENCERLRWRDQAKGLYSGFGGLNYDDRIKCKYIYILDALKSRKSFTGLWV